MSTQSHKAHEHHDEAPMKDEWLSGSAPAGINKQMEHEDVSITEAVHNAVVNDVATPTLDTRVFYDHMSPDNVQGFVNRMTHKYETYNTPGLDSSVEQTPSHMASPMRSGSIDCHAAGLDGEHKPGGHIDTSDDRIPYGTKGKWTIAADEQLAKDIEAAEWEAAHKHREAKDRLVHHIENARSLMGSKGSDGKSVPHTSHMSHTHSDSQVPEGTGYESEDTISEPSSVYSSDLDSTRRRKWEKKK
ncbi:hypothetical protein IW261DRAFT_1425390 [Armillaria novae-zelandiae]|uniref:Uncharacterized protein n=1 Tax=Armillaria novae-zelandiae TaxID=153914 RepID=A0AA39T866_9AGAR|nr:hypothetical protein IW261DRAFT_1425390 [Armillaria novae-zelandiae]